MKRADKIDIIAAVLFHLDQEEKRRSAPPRTLGEMMAPDATKKEHEAASQDAYEIRCKAESALDYVTKHTRARIKQIEAEES